MHTIAKPHLNWVLPLLALCAVALALLGASGDALWHLRLPRVASGFVVGALLALSGLAMQVLLRNPLADPYVLGTSSGAAAGAITALLLGSAMWLGAAVGALLASSLLLTLARRALALHDESAAVHMTLIGAMLAACLGAASTLLLTLTPDEQLRGAVFWLVGDLSTSSASVDGVLGVNVVVGNLGLWLAVAWLFVFLVFLMRHSRSVDRLMLGAEAAAQLGVPVARLRLALLLLASLAVAVCVAMSGAIGFVGLVVPQWLRLGGVFATKRLAWLSALGGGALLVLADTAARTVAYPLELPVGAVMALIGAPALMWFLSRGVR
jgi:iron complex transport system permease protein